MELNEAILKRLEKLERELERQNAYIEIQNIMGLYEILLVPQTMDRVAPETFAMWRDDVSMEVADKGVYCGPKGVQTLFADVMGHGEPEKDGIPDLRGAFYIHQLNTPMIEIAKDGQTAHGVWFSCGYETPFNIKMNRRQAKWCWGKYSAEFIKGKEGWRIWHLHWFRGFMVDFYRSWVDGYQEDIKDQTDRSQYQFIKPTTFHQPYSPYQEIMPVPRCPKPYETHKDSSWVYEDWVK